MLFTYQKATVVRFLMRMFFEKASLTNPVQLFFVFNFCLDLEVATFLTVFFDLTVLLISARVQNHGVGLELSEVTR